MSNCVIADIKFLTWVFDTLGYPTKKDALTNLQTSDKVRLGELYVAYTNGTPVVSEYFRYDPKTYNSTACCMFCTKYLSYDEMREVSKSTSGEFRCRKHTSDRAQRSRNVSALPPITEVSNDLSQIVNHSTYASANANSSAKTKTVENVNFAIQLLTII
jgi:hypothetical protein